MMYIGGGIPGTKVTEFSIKMKHSDRITWAKDMEFSINMIQWLEILTLCPGHYFSTGNDFTMSWIGHDVSIIVILLMIDIELKYCTMFALLMTALDLLHCLFTTLLVIIIFLVTMSSDPLMSCLGAVLESFFCPQCWQLTDYY
jgi:hypothetical protein